MKRIASVLLVLLALPVYAQGSSDPAPKADPAMTSARDLWDGITKNIIASAELMPEGDYSYRPVGTVRTFGQMIGHVAGAQYMFCAAALGDPPRAEADIEKSVTTKAGLVSAMKASTEYCRRAYAMTDAAAGSGMIKMFGQDMTKLHTMIMNATHNGEHYGNLVTYMRVKGMVPPSSQPQPAR